MTRWYCVSTTQANAAFTGGYHVDDDYDVDDDNDMDDDDADADDNDDDAAADDDIAAADDDHDADDDDTTMTTLMTMTTMTKTTTTPTTTNFFSCCIVKRHVYFFGYVLRLYWKVIIPVQDGSLVGPGLWLVTREWFFCVIRVTESSYSVLLGNRLAFSVPQYWELH